MRTLLALLPLLAALALPAMANEHVPPTAAVTAPAPAQGWKTDAPLREGMGRIRVAVDALQHGEHGYMGPRQVSLLASGIERDVGFIVAHCKLDPSADAALHPILGALMRAAQALKANPTDTAAIPSMRSALHDYARQFDDPGTRAGEPEEAR